MSRLTVTVNTDNAAFDDEAKGPELARILRQLADRLEAGETPDAEGWLLRDINGNRVGAAEQTEDTE